MKQLQIDLTQIWNLEICKVWLRPVSVWHWLQGWSGVWLCSLSESSIIDSGCALLRPDGHRKQPEREHDPLRQSPDSPHSLCEANIKNLRARLSQTDSNKSTILMYLWSWNAFSAIFHILSCGWGALLDNSEKDINQLTASDRYECKEKWLKAEFVCIFLAVV